MEIIAIIAAWVLYGAIHSALADLNIRRKLVSRFPALEPKYRLFYNAIAIMLLAGPLWTLQIARPSPLLWIWPAWAIPLQFVLTIGALALFVWSLRYYNLGQFIGLQAPGNPALVLSPLHRYVRHPWYTCALVFIWVQNMDLAGLVTASCVSLYFWLGSKLEERKLVLEFGPAYELYQTLVPALVPCPGRKLSKLQAQEIMSPLK